eukprot:468524-Lingulodinium_polyedra.AAC.1
MTRAGRHGARQCLSGAAGGSAPRAGPGAGSNSPGSARPRGARSPPGQAPGVAASRSSGNAVRRLPAIRWC